MRNRPGFLYYSADHTFKAANSETLVIIKPDAVARGLAWKILQRFEDAGLQTWFIQSIDLTRENLEAHYAEHKGKGFFVNLIESMCDREAFLVILNGLNAVRKARQLIGPTNCLQAPPGTIRGDFGGSDGGPNNLVHASADQEAFLREVRVWFPDVPYGNENAQT